MVCVVLAIAIVGGIVVFLVGMLFERINSIVTQVEEIGAGLVKMATGVFAIEAALLTLKAQMAQSPSSQTPSETPPDTPAPTTVTNTINSTVNQ